MTAEFVGVGRIAERQEQTLALFEAAAAAGDWGRIHSEHYDWWMFPIDQPSAHGRAYTVDPDAVAALRALPGFLDRYRRGVRLLLLAWGWDVDARAPVSEPGPDQRWAHWPIRLEKCGRSLWLLGEHQLYAGVRAYAMTLIEAGVPLGYRGRDCGDWFREHE